MNKHTANPGPAPQSKRSAFIVAYTCLLAFAFVFQSLPPVLGQILADLRLDHAKGGLLMGLFAIPGVFLTIPGGWLADRMGTKTIAIGALLITIAGTLTVAVAPGFFWLGFGRLVAGVGAMTLVVTAASLISSTFSGRDLGMAMGFYNTGMPVGTIVSFTILGAYGGTWGWRLSMFLPVAVSVAALALLVFMKPPIKQASSAGLGAALRASGGKIWFLGLTWLWFNAAAIAFLTFGPDYFTGLSYTSRDATFLASLIMWGALLVSPAIGPLMSGPVRKEAFMVAGALGPAIIYALLPVSSAVWMLMVLLGLASALLPAPLFAMPADLVGREQQGLAFGILSTCLNIGVLLGPFAVGWSRDATGSYEGGFLLMALFSALAAVSVLPLLWPGRRRRSR